MASEDEVRLGRLAVKQGFATEQQVIDALRVRNTKGGELGEILKKSGLVTDAQLGALRRLATSGQGAPPADRADASTDIAISITGTREILARDQLVEALHAAKRDPKSALRELRRLAEDFPDTESGVRAEREARDLATRVPEP